MSSRLDYTTGEPQTVDQARDAIERSRQRISSTLDALEDRIVEKKHAFQERVDVLRPVRDQVTRRPMTAAVVAIGVGALLGSMGGRSHERSTERTQHDGAAPLSKDERKELREWRKRRHARWEAHNRQREREHDEERGHEGLSKFKNQLMGAVTSAIGAAVTAKVKDFTGTGANHRGDGRAR